MKTLERMTDKQSVKLETSRLRRELAKIERKV